MYKDQKNKNKRRESSDSTSSDLSEICQSVHELMAELGHLEPIQEEAVAPQLVTRSPPPTAEVTRPPPPTAEWLSKEDWSALTKTQKRSLLRKRREAREGTSAPVEPGSGAKRQREAAGFTPSPNKEERKRPKLESRYSQALSCLKVAIMHREYPEELPEDLCNRLIRKMVEGMRENNPEEGTITFCGYTYRTGALVINCMDERSRSWLIDRVARLSPWEGKPLKVGDPKHLEGFRRLGAFIPSPVEGVEVVLKTIKAQNAINTDRWKILPGGSKMQPRGLYFVASIPESHYKIVESKNFMIGHGFNLIEMKPLRERGDKRAEATRMEVEEHKSTSGAGDRGPVSATEGADGGSATSGVSAGQAAVDKLRHHRLGGRRELRVASDARAGAPGAVGSPGGQSGSESVAGRQEALSGADAGLAVGENLGHRGKPDSGPPPL